MAYETKIQDIPEGFIHLGEDFGASGIAPIGHSEVEGKSEPQFHYPELHFSGEHAEKLKELGDHGTAVVHFKKISESHRIEHHGGKEKHHHSVGLQIHGIKPHKAEKSAKSEKSMSSAKEVSHMTHPSSSHDDAIEKGLDAAAEETKD
jgi:hypothetical protein